ncbi:Sec-independent protein translocase protein TatCy [Rubripirellula lacrimiformis]|uniref:Sec-independent protein translocase protein TatC n=1 Tax=Rubripirellula lacrimiformis TaxID=1930273 RepID=A0A517N704_9BACT|nr:twin-arginine translocase subunit TatC [Rubripirellula lacrimiformis]QDT02923.1 Sec-independent protein translocase protein TatCy [Rubripirellula lacrimiformis]
MDRLARPKDDLFDNSTMTFGEHLDELRQCLVKAILWLAGGLIIGLFFADSVILFIQRPLESAIREFQADRDLHQMGYDPHADEVQPLRTFLAGGSLIAEIVYDVPEEFQKLTMDSLIIPSATTSAQSGDAASAGLDAPLEQVTVEPRQLADILGSLPDPSQLQPRLQLRQNKTGLSSLKMEEPFMIWVKAGLIVGAIFASPMIFYHIWAFVAAGLHDHERRYVYIYLPLSVVLFISGVVLAFFLVLHYVLAFLLAFNGSMEVAIEPRLSYYVNFVLMLPLGFGIAFQLPLVMLFVQRIGILETQAYVDSWKVAVLVIFVIAMVVTPADVTSMVALAIPLVFLYMLGILMCMLIPRGRGLGSDAYDPA